MLVLDKQNSNVVSIAHLPEILTVNKAGEAMGWINYEDCARQYSKGNVLYSLGTYEVVLRGGINAVTGQQSKFKMDSIIALDCDKSPRDFRKYAPALTNDALFERDLNLCAYCGYKFKARELTCDHILPTSKGGKDVWENVVAACRPCNAKKDNMTPEQADMQLLFVPYTPNYYEHLILVKNRKILADQMEFLMRGVHKHSRLHTLN